MNYKSPKLDKDLVERFMPSATELLHHIEDVHYQFYEAHKALDIDITHEHKQHYEEMDNELTDMIFNLETLLDQVKDMSNKE